MNEDNFYIDIVYSTKAIVKSTFAFLIIYTRT